MENQNPMGENTPPNQGNQNPSFQQTQANPVFNNPNDALMKEKLDVTIIYILSISGLVFSCCCIGFIPAIIAYVMSVQKINKYKANPERYYGIEQMKTANIVALVIMILTLLGLVYSIVSLIMSAGDLNMIMENYREMGGY